MLGFDGRSLKEKTGRGRVSGLVNLLRNLSIHANVFTRVKNAVARAFAVPSFAMAVA